MFAGPPNPRHHLLLLKYTVIILILKKCSLYNLWSQSINKFSPKELDLNSSITSESRHAVTALATFFVEPSHG